MQSEIEGKTLRRAMPARASQRAEQTFAGRVASINLSQGGVPKHAVPEGFITPDGLLGDQQQDLQYHGGAERAVVIYSVELILALKREGHPIVIGGAGENLTLSGLDWDSMVPGVELDTGGAKLQLTKYATPCYKISASFRDGEIARISHKLHPGWSRVCARVLQPGAVRVGDAVKLTRRLTFSRSDANAQKL